MFTSTKAMRLAAAAAVAFFGGLSTPAWATYGGGACHRCAPPAVVESQCNVVALAPQVQTVYQTVYETVYEYEPTGLGNCTALSENVEAGCVALLSSGESEQESAFLDASESGEDVFFLTSAKLSPLDPDTEADVYDARVCQQDASEPCPTYAPPPPSQCSSEACKAGYVPTAGGGSPATTSISSSGNIEVLGTKETKKVEVKRAPTRAQLLAKALKICKRDKSRRKRISCEKQARKKYGPAKSAKRSSTDRGGRS